MALTNNNASDDLQSLDDQDDRPDDYAGANNDIVSAEPEIAGLSTQNDAVAILSSPATSPLHPFYSLPSELILDIVDLLPPEAFINFAFANYPLLHAYGLAPALSRPRVLYITTQTTIPALFPLLRMPAEIMLQIMRNLKPIDTMRFVVANYQDLSRQGIAPPLTEVMVRQLRNAVGAQITSVKTGVNSCRCPDQCGCDGDEHVGGGGGDGGDGGDGSEDRAKTTGSKAS